MANKPKKPAANKKVTGIDELLALLKRRPSLVRALVLDPAKVKSLLKSRAAKQLFPRVGAATGERVMEGGTDPTPGPPPPIVSFRCLKRSA